MPVIEVRDLVTHYLTTQGPVDAVSGLNFTVEKGQTFGLAGIIIGPILLTLFVSLWEIYKLLNEYDERVRLSKKSSVNDT